MTVITIAHRISSILDHDRVLILEHGEVVSVFLNMVLLVRIVQVDKITVVHTHHQQSHVYLLSEPY